jgi:transcriptional regulator with XRE-family HTH domain
MLSANQARDLGDGLRRLRQRKGLTRYQAAEVCGLPHVVYAWLEHGRLPSEDQEHAMARAWGALQMYHVARGA